MAWITPKTDWGAKYDSNGNYIGDYFNVSDYERITNNLLILKDLYISYNKPEIDFINPRSITIESLAYASDFNAIEKNAEELISHFGGLDDLVGHIKTYLDNGRTIDFNELNRIESLSLTIYELLPIEYRNEAHLEFSLGLQNIGEFSTLAREVV